MFPSCIEHPCAGVEGVTNTLLDQLWESFMGPVIFWPLLADGMYAGISPAATSVASVLSNSAARSGPPQSLPPVHSCHVHGCVIHWHTRSRRCVHLARSEAPVYQMGACSAAS